LSLFFLLGRPLFLDPLADRPQDTDWEGESNPLTPNPVEIPIGCSVAIEPPLLGSVTVDRLEDFGLPRFLFGRTVAVSTTPPPNLFGFEVTIDIGRDTVGTVPTVGTGEGPTVTG
jgi:hypothetical protein